MHKPLEELRAVRAAGGPAVTPHPTVYNARRASDAPPRREDCPHRSKCLTVAIRQSWPGWSCQLCELFDAQAAPEPEPSAPIRP